MERKKILLFPLLLLGTLMIVLSACQPSAEGTEPAAESMAPERGELTVPFLEAWQSSGHAKWDAEAFRHWDEDDPQVVEIDCARCHSTFGYQDYIVSDFYGSVSNCWISSVVKLTILQ